MSRVNGEKVESFTRIKDENGRVAQGEDKEKIILRIYII